MLKLSIKSTMFIAITMMITMLMSTIALSEINPLDGIGHRYVDEVAFVPLREAAYAFDATVEWDADTRTVHITDVKGNIYIIDVSAEGGFTERGISFITVEHAARIFNIQESGLGIHGAIHRVEYGDNVAYLFGTMHAWRDGWSPLADVVVEALMRSDVLALEFESTDSESMDAAHEYAMYLRDGQTWSEFLPRSVYEYFVELMWMWELAYDEETQYFNPQFIVELLFEEIQLAMMQDELQVGTESVDNYIMNIAQAEGLQIIGLESVMQQIELLYHPPIEVIIDNIMRLPTPREVLMFMAYERDRSSNYGGHDEMARLYETNNIPGIINSFAKSQDRTNESVAAAHFREMVGNWRSTYYAERISELLQETEEPTTFFVAVGLSHIIRSGAGEGFTDIVQQLRLLGFEVLPLF